MKMTARFTGVPATYRELLAMHPPRPIHTNKELDAASDIVGKMIGHSLNKDQEDYMDLLATLIADYESKTPPFSSKEMTPLQALKYVMEEGGMSASDLGRLLGNRELGSKILRGERGLSTAHIVALADRFAVNPSFFLSTPAEKPSRKSKLTRSWRTSGQKTTSMSVTKLR